MQIFPRRFRALTLLSVFVAVGACQCDRLPGELRPLVSELPFAPSFDACTANVDCTQGSCDFSTGFCTAATSQTNRQFSVRNVGDDTVTIKSASCVGADASVFTAIDFDKPSLLADEQAQFSITYIAADGAAKASTLVIESDAAVNPKLKVPVSVVLFDPAVIGGGSGSL